MAAGKSLTLVAVAGAGMILAAGCGSGSHDPSAGPLGPLEADGNACLQDNRAAVVTDGWPYVRDNSKTPAVITGLALRNPRGMRLITVYAVPTTVGYGVAPGYPPAKGSPVNWALHRNAVGAVIRHASERGQITDLLFVIRITAPRASASGVEISYRAGGQDYQLRTPFGLIVVAPHKNC